VSTTITAITAALQGQLAEALGVNAIRVYPTPVDASEAPSRGAAVMIRFLGRESLSPCNEHARFELVVSVPAMDRQWPASVGLLRSYLDLTGDLSIEATIEADRTLGGLVSDAVATGTDRERLVEYHDGKRWSAPVFVSVYYEG
jgi:hypothetical protein